MQSAQLLRCKIIFALSYMLSQRCLHRIDKNSGADHIRNVRRLRTKDLVGLLALCVRAA